MKKYIEPKVYTTHIAAATMLAASTLSSVDEGRNTSVTIGGQNSEGEDFTVKSSHVQWDDWE